MTRGEDLTHINEQGRARMVDVSAKEGTQRVARAAGFVHMVPATLELVRTGGCKKGDVLAVAQVAGIMAAKRCWELVPMCHPIQLTGVDVRFELSDAPCGVAIEAECRCCGQTGVEMEALTAASVAGLTIYDMLKAVQRDMVVSDVRLLEKSGGKSGHFVRGSVGGVGKGTVPLSTFPPPRPLRRREARPCLGSRGRCATVQTTNRLMRPFGAVLHGGDGPFSITCPHGLRRPRVTGPGAPGRGPSCTCKSSLSNGRFAPCP